MKDKICVIKHDGSREPYHQEKVLGSILRAGIAQEKVFPILNQVETRLYNGITTAELYRIVTEEIKKQGFPESLNLYHLREILAKVGSIEFEKLVKLILEREGYICQWNQVLAGFCVEHQLDVVAKSSSGRLYLVEMKHHRSYHRNCGLGTVAELWARLEDLQKGYSAGRNRHHFAAAWLITNTKFSDHAKKYAGCKRLRLTGWRRTLSDLDGSEDNEGLEKIVRELGAGEVARLVKQVGTA